MSNKSSQRQRHRKPKSRPGKSRGGGKSNGKPSASTRNPKTTEEKARAAEMAGDPARARAGYVRLFREDPEKFGDDYRRISRQAFQVLLRDGSSAKAEQILKQCAEWLSAEELAEWGMRLAAGREEWSVALPAALQLLAAERLECRLVAADVIVGATMAPDGLALPNEARRARRAMELFCEGKTTEAMGEARAVPRASPFASWSIFLKGAAALYDGDQEAAANAFQRLPEHGAAAKIAGTLLTFKGGGTEDSSEEPSQSQDAKGRGIALMLELNGETDAACLFPETLQTNDARGLAGAYDFARDRLRDFPSLDHGCAAVLTSYFLGAAAHQPDQGRLIDRMRSRKRGSTMDAFVAAVLSMRRAGHEPYYGDDPWPKFHQAAERALGDWRHWNLVQAFALLDEAAELEKEYGRYDYLDQEEKDEVLDLLRKAVKLAPGSEAVALKLLETLGRFRAKSERNRFLDEAATRFPDNAAILAMAADRCVERNSRNKALKYYEQAIELDPTNSGTVHGLVQCALNLAIKYYSLRKNLKGAEMMEVALRHAPDSGSPYVHVGFVMARRSLFADLFENDPPGAAEWKSRAAERIPGDALEFFMAAMTCFYRPRFEMVSKGDLHGRMVKASSQSGADSVVMMLDTMRLIKATGMRGASKERVLTRLQEVFSGLFATCIRRAPDAPRKAPEILSRLIGLERMPDVTSRLLPAWLRARGDEEGEIAAALIDAAVQLDIRIFSSGAMPSVASLKDLEERAAARNIPELRDLARELGNGAREYEAHSDDEQDERFAPGDIFGGFFDDDDDDDDDDEEEDDEEFIDSMFGPPGVGGPGPPAGFAELIRAVAFATAAEREALRRTIGIPKEEWNALIRSVEKARL